MREDVELVKEGLRSISKSLQLLRFYLKRGMEKAVDAIHSKGCLIFFGMLIAYSIKYNEPVALMHRFSIGGGFTSQSESMIATEPKSLPAHEIPDIIQLFV